MTTETLTCECSDEYGPCEQHGETLVVREGASLHTADELALLLIDDLADLGQGDLSPWGQEVVNEARSVLANNRLIEDLDLSQALYDVSWQVQNNADLLVYEDDGYRIVKPSADCPLYE